MCFIISIVMLVLSYNFYISENTLAALGSFAVATFFIYLMVKNTIYIKNLKKKESEKKSDS